jgi:Flp pilus assembly protein TadG
MGLLNRFFRSVSGNFAITASIAMIPLLVAAGFAVDHTRQTSAQRHLQEMTDAAALGLAIDRERNERRMRQLAEDHLQANHRGGRLNSFSLDSVEADDDKVRLTASGWIPAGLMGLAGYDRLQVSATSVAERAIRGNLEVAMVLDNTWSMSAADAGGTTRLQALKSAASMLVRQLLQDKNGSVRIGLVPYAEYVNVGTQYRNAPWLSVPNDYTTSPSPRTCEIRTTRTRCIRQNPTYACTRTYDGVSEPATCGGGCAERETYSVEPYEVCSGGGEGTAYRWFGCVGSRTIANTRLNDTRPDVRYPGYVETHQRCLNPIVRLTNNRDTLLNAVNGMVINIGSYRPNTYIPAGLMWGLNVLSPQEPFADSAAYDPKNERPRRVAILMTDGENTLRFSASDGRHVPFEGNGIGQLRQTNRDTVQICDYMKRDKHIELYSIAFMVTNPEAKSVLEDCASSKAHYFDASDEKGLIAAFEEISNSLRVVRLTH